MQFRKALSFAMLVWFCCLPATTAFTGETTYEAIKPIKQLTVCVEDVTLEIMPNVNTGNVKAALEAKLTEGGIKVVSAENNNVSPLAVLFINIVGLKLNSAKKLVYSVEAFVARRMWLDGEGKKSFLATVWSTTGLTVAPEVDTKAIETTVVAEVGEYIKDWQAANAR